MPDLEHGHDEPSRPLGSIQIGGYARGPSLVAGHRAWGSAGPAPGVAALPGARVYEKYMEGDQGPAAGGSGVLCRLLLSIHSARGDLAGVAFASSFPVP